MFKAFFIFYFILSIGSSIYGQKVFVAVAANMQLPCEEIEAAFEAENDVSVELIIGASGKLTVQIKNGAPYHLFLSADMKYPTILYESGYTTSLPQIYAYGVPVLWLKATVADSGITALDKLERQGAHPRKVVHNTFPIRIFKNSKIKKIAIADPRLAPYGVAAMQIFNHFKVEKTVKNKLIFGSSIAGVNQYIAADAVDAAITASSARKVERLKNKGSWLELPDESYSPIAQGIIQLAYSQKNMSEASKRFYNFLFSKTARGILQKYGYRLP